VKPYRHARSSAAKYGGFPDDYLAIHDYMDSTKSAVPDVRHRAILHSAFGVFIVEFCEPQCFVVFYHRRIPEQLSVDS